MESLELSQGELDEMEYEAALATGVFGNTIKNAGKIFASSKAILEECDQLLHCGEEN